MIFVIIIIIYFIIIKIINRKKKNAKICREKKFVSGLRNIIYYDAEKKIRTLYNRLLIWFNFEL